MYPWHNLYPSCRFRRVSAQQHSSCIMPKKKCIHAEFLLYSFTNLKSAPNTFSHTLKKVNQQPLVCQNPQNLLQKSLIRCGIFGPGDWYSFFSSRTAIYAPVTSRRGVIISDKEDEDKSSHHGQTLDHNSDILMISDEEITAKKELGK